MLPTGPRQEAFLQYKNTHSIVTFSSTLKAANTLYEPLESTFIFCLTHFYNQNKNNSILI